MADVRKMDFQKFLNVAAHEVYDALERKYDVRNAIVKEVSPKESSQMAVILVTKRSGLPAQEPYIKKLSQSYVEYDLIYHCNIKEFAKGFAKEVAEFYDYVNPEKN